MKRLIFDIETKPQPADVLLEKFKPTFEANKTLKDPEKIAADLLAKKAEWLDKSALHAERAEICAVGWTADGILVEMVIDSEFNILGKMMSILRERSLFCGFNILGFDLPMIRRRCLLNGISFPFYDVSDKWKPWTIPTYDAMVDWQCGNRKEFISLNTLACALGVGKKNGDGKLFHKLLETDPKAAREYLHNDVTVTYNVVEKMLGKSN